MARRKFRHSQRKNSPGQRSYQEYLSNGPAPITNRTELLRLINGGEDTYLELKVKLSNPERIAQEIVALANTAGGTIIFGVNDQLRVEGLRDPNSVQTELIRICREEIFPPITPFIDTIAFDNGNRVVAVEIRPKHRPYRTSEGKFFLRVGAEKREAGREELSDLLDEARPLSYENVPIPAATDDDFDDALLWSFAKGFELNSNGHQSYETKTFLKNDLLLAVGSPENFMPTVAAVLLFGKNERVSKLVPQSRVVAVRYAGKDDTAEVVERVIFSGNLLTLNDRLNEFVERYCDLRKFKSKRSPTVEDSPVNPRGNYHIYSIREAIANLLTHRDLAIRDIESRVSVFDGAIEFTNPRRTNGFVPPASKAIKFGITQRINPQIASIFLRREYGAKLPQGGLPMILKQSQIFSGKRVEVLTRSDQFQLRICSS